MKILILGGTGMLGHQLWRSLQSRHETWVTLRRPAADYHARKLFEVGQVVEGLDATDHAAVTRVLAELRPQVVLNCVGIIKQLKEAHDHIPSLTINSLLPHRLADLCDEIGARLVLFSTDCVFSGQRGQYREDDFADARDLYGRTKFLGEITNRAHVVTLRSSIIGRELGSAHSLIDWFLSQQSGRVRGFRRAIYTGFTTIEMARIVETILCQHPQLSGLWQVASSPISKYDLLRLVREKYGRQIEIDPDDVFACDRSLIGTRFAAATGYQAPAWEEMIAEMAQADGAKVAQS